jgi:hypothetical protein
MFIFQFITKIFCNVETADFRNYAVNTACFLDNSVGKSG